MKDGESMEMDTNDNIFKQPKSPYTQSLLSAMPVFNP